MIYIALKMSILGDFCGKRPVYSCVMSSWVYLYVVVDVLCPVMHNMNVASGKYGLVEKGHSAKIMKIQFYLK